MSEEKTAEIIMHPGIINIAVYCNHCMIQGSILSFKRHFDSITRARFWCERCKTVNKNNINIDLQLCPELNDVPFIPLKVIKWDAPTQT